MGGSHGTTSRRRFISMTGAIGATSGLFQAMTGITPATAASAWSGPMRMPSDIGAGKKVLILGAGIAGLTAAYELKRQGYSVTVLEAQKRAGGRSFTAREGSEIKEISPAGGFSTQKCQFDSGLYLNLGPGRLPHHHRRVLNYCKVLKVPLEPYVMETTANVLQTSTGFGGNAKRNSQIANDTRGHLADLLVKSVNNGSLDMELGPADRAVLKDLLRVFGDLEKEKLVYEGSTRSGYRRPLSVRQMPEPAAPLDFRELLKSRFWAARFYQPIDWLWQATMFQPVGGMDKIVDAFVNDLEPLIVLEAPVTKITLLPNQVTVSYQHAGVTNTATADYCLSNIPVSVLKNVERENFSESFNDAVTHIEFEPACKVGWQANQRFWESDTNQIYGGISWTDHLITQMWYPSYDYFSEKGTLTGAYNFGDPAVKLGEMSLADRLDTAREGALKLHPEFGNDSVVPQRLGVSIAWHKVPYQLGGWAQWDPTKPADTLAYARLLAPDGRFHVIGDQASPLPGWQEGAMMSAEYVVNQLAGTERSAVPIVRRAPDSRAITQGTY